MWLGSVQREFRGLLGDLRDLLGREEEEDKRGDEEEDEREGQEGQEGMEKRGMEKKEGEVEKEEVAGWERKRRRRNSFLWMTTTTTNLGVVQLRVGRDLVERWRVGSMEEVSAFLFFFLFPFSFFEEQKEMGWNSS